MSLQAASDERSAEKLKLSASDITTLSDGELGKAEPGASRPDSQRKQSGIGMLRILKHKIFNRSTMDLSEECSYGLGEAIGLIFITFDTRVIAIRDQVRW